ncbi:hypothetical protein AURDEDRAFT_153111 [Auricularia subglabra TFB-10046 SS5]|nr:hypothetical protein AURDEDRAFT_153111 [Auricularia subglabra TFB-10046 SS5]
MATATPARKIVRWAYDIANSSLGSPPQIDPSLNDATFESDVDSDDGGLAYVNAQLLAHGFAHGNGLDLGGLDAGSAKAVVKCIMGLLSQRANDVSRTEELTTKYRNLSYDHERLLSLHRTQLEKTARAEQDTQRFKARLAVAQRDLATVESQKKAALADLSRTRTSLQYLRTTSQQELRRLEKDKQTFSDRFTKVSDAQLHLGGATAGFYFSTGQPANAVALDGASVGGSAGLLETSLKAAEDARQQLMTENDELREVLLAAANRLQNLTQDATALSQGPDAAMTELMPLTAAEVFSPPTSTLSNAHNAHAKLMSMTNGLRDALTSLANGITNASAPPTAQEREQDEKSKADIERLQGVINKLKEELEQAKAESATFAAQAQELFDRFTSDEQFMGTAPQGPAEQSFEIDAAAGRDELQEQLEQQQAQLDEERRKFTESAVALGRQRRELEAQRLAFLEEKRTWQVQQILAELPPTPPAASASPARPKPSPVALPATKPFPSSSIEALLRPQIPTAPVEPAEPDAEVYDEPPLPTKGKSPRKSFSPPHPKRVSFAVGGPTSPLKRKSPPRHQRRLSSPLFETPGRAVFGRKAGPAKHAFSPARPSPLSRIMMLADDSSMMEGVPEAEDEDEGEDENEVSAEDQAQKEQDEHDEMFPALPSAQRSPTRISFPPMPTSLAAELKLGASGLGPRTSFPANAGPLVSFDFAKELEAAVSRPSTPSPEPSEQASSRPSSRTVRGADSSDEDLRIVKGTAGTGANKENKRPRGAPPQAPVPGPSKVAPAAKPRAPLSPRKMKEKPKPAPAAPAKVGAAKRVPAPAPAPAPVPKRISPPPATTGAKRISPVPPATTAVKRVSPPALVKPAPTKSVAPVRTVPTKAMGAKRVPVSGPSGWK